MYKLATHTDDFLPCTAVACGDIKRSPSGYYARIGRDWETFDPSDYEYGY